MENKKKNTSKQKNLFITEWTLKTHGYKGIAIKPRIDIDERKRISQYFVVYLPKKYQKNKSDKRVFKDEFEAVAFSYLLYAGKDISKEAKNYIKTILARHEKDER